MMSANTRNAYEIVWDSSALQVTCAGRTITVSLKAYDTAIREAQQADFTLLAVADGATGHGIGCPAAKR